MTLTTEDGKPCEGIEQGPFEPIAVVGLGALMPDAHNIDAFWQNILDAKVSIKPSRRDDGQAPSIISGKKGGPGSIRKGTPTRKSERWSRRPNSIGVDGDNRRGRFLKSTRVNSGQ